MATSAPTRPEQRAQLQPARGSHVPGFRRAIAWVAVPLVAHRRALLAMNLLYWGVALLAALYGLAHPELQRALVGAAGVAFGATGPLAPVGGAYETGQLVQAIALTLVVNLLVGSLGMLTVPSAIIPFFGLLGGMYRAVLWGLLFAPAGAPPPGTLLLHLPTIAVEGEAYVVAMLGVWLWWWPVVTTPGARRRAWLAGLRLQARVYAAVALLLAVAAIYEALELIYLVPRLS
jgi:hypothetical protein